MSTAYGLPGPEHVSGLLPAYVNGTLSPDERATVQAHVEDCLACRTEHAAWQKVQSATWWAMHAAPTTSPGLDQMWTTLDALETPMSAKTVPSPAFGIESNLRPIASDPRTSSPNDFWRRLPVANLATAALILLTLLASVVAFGGRFRQMSPDEQPALAPVATDSADAGLPTGILEDVTLMQAVFNSIPENARWAGIEHSTLAPGAAWELGTSQSDGEGPLLYRVEAGVLTIQAEGPITVIRAGSEQSITAPAGTEIELSAGDQGFTPGGVKSRWRNDGDVPVTVMDAGITTIGLGFPPPEVRHAQFAWTSDVYPPPASALVAVRRVTLAAGAAIPTDAFPGLAVGYVESGQVLIANSLATPTPSSALSFHAPYQLFGVHPGRVLHVTGPEPATVLLMTINNPNPLEGSPMD